MPFLDPLIPLAKEWQIFDLFCSSELSNTFQQNLLWVVGLQQFPLMCGDWRHVLRVHLADTFAGNCLWYVPYGFFTTAMFPSEVRQDVFVLGVGWIQTATSRQNRWTKVRLKNDGAGCWSHRSNVPWQNKSSAFVFSQGCFQNKSCDQWVLIN